MASKEPEKAKSDLTTVAPESDDRRTMTLSDGREIHIKPIKMRQFPRWSAYFYGIASVQGTEDGKVNDSIKVDSESLARVAAAVPELGEQFYSLMDLCLVGASSEDIDQDDGFDVLERFVELNLTQEFLGKVMARAFGVRG